MQSEGVLYFSRTAKRNITTDGISPFSTAAIIWSTAGRFDDPILESMTDAIIESRLEQDKILGQFLEAYATTQLLKNVADVLG